MNQSEEIEKLKLELENFKKEVNAWYINVKVIIKEINFAVDKQNRNLLKLKRKVAFS